jgi:prepilin-type N-terminal cleavage/methylation domain-containing protein
MSRSAFTLIELLIVIGVIAILSVVVILVLNPAELLKQSRDAARLSDMDNLNKAVALFNTDVGGSLGAASTTYLSIPDPVATSSAGDQCQGLGLSLGPAYHCASSSTYRNVDGTGWIPVNLTQISFGRPLGSLALDPTNTSSSGFYYAYTSGGGAYAMTAAMESQKYLKTATNLGGLDPTRYWTGTNVALVAQAEGLVGYWTFDEGAGTVAKDSSGNGNDGTWQAGSSYTSGKVGPYAGNFTGSNYVTAPRVLPTSSSTPFTFSAWTFLTGSSVYETIIGTAGSLAQISFMSAAPCIAEDGGGGFFYCSTAISKSVWHHIVGVYDGANASLYVDGILMLVPQAHVFIANHGAALIGTYSGGSELMTGLIDDVRVYNRALSAAEIQAMYNAQK